MTEIHAPGTETCGCCRGTTASTPPDDQEPARPRRDRLPQRHPRRLPRQHAGGPDRWRPARPGHAADPATRRPDDRAARRLRGRLRRTDLLLRAAGQRVVPRTALDRTSLQELGKLVGYRPAPGFAAETLLRIHPGAADAGPGRCLAPTRGSRRPRSRRGSDAAGAAPSPDIPGPGETAADLRDRRADRGAAGVELDGGRRHRPAPAVAGRPDVWFAGADLNLGRGAPCCSPAGRRTPPASCRPTAGTSGC